MKLHPIVERYLLSGTDTPYSEVPELSFNDWIHQRVWRVKPLVEREMTFDSIVRYSLLRDAGYLIDKVTGSFTPPRGTEVYYAFSSDINDIVFTLHVVPTEFIPSLFLCSTLTSQD